MSRLECAVLALWALAFAAAASAPLWAMEAVRLWEERRWGRERGRKGRERKMATHDLRTWPAGLGFMVIGEAARSPPWFPTLVELADLLRACGRGDLSCSHTNYGQWSFWRKGHPVHATLSHTEGAFYLRATDGGRPSWATKTQVLAALGLGASGTEPG